MLLYNIRQEIDSQFQQQKKVKKNTIHAIHKLLDKIIFISKYEENPSCLLTSASFLFLEKY